MNCYGKMYNRWLLQLAMSLPWPDLHCAGTHWHFGDFRNVFLPNIGEDQKKSPSEREASGTVPYGKSGPSYYISFIKRLDDSLR